MKIGAIIHETSLGALYEAVRLWYICHSTK